MATIGTSIETAASLLLAGEVVAIPTETVYGLAAVIHSEGAIRKVFSVKNRPFTDPLIVHVKDIEAIRPLVTDFPPLARKLMEAFSPGPLTVLFPKSEEVPDLVTNSSPLVAIRIPRHPVCLALLKRVGVPIAAPSANPFGGISPTKANHVQTGIGDKIPYILDGGQSEVGLESTIVQILAGDKLKVLRKGGISEEELQLFAELVGEEKVTKEFSEPVVPGSMLSHYAPTKPLHFFSEQRIKNSPPDSTGILCFREFVPGFPQQHQRRLSPKGDLVEAARNLFDALHELDELPVGQILSERFPEQGLGKAIQDRLYRASQKRT